MRQPIDNQSIYCQYGAMVDQDGLGTPVPMDAALMRRALEDLDQRIDAGAHLVIGGGAAMVLAYDHPLATQDVDAFAGRTGLGVPELARVGRQTALALGIAPDWLNAHFETFTHVLPADFGSRLRRIYEGTHLTVDALGPEDLLVMKCFAGRDKDLPHARKLIRIADDLGVVDRHLSELGARRIPGAERAADFFDDLRDEADR